MSQIPDADTGLTNDEAIAATVLERLERGVPEHMLIVGAEAKPVARVLAQSIMLNQRLLAERAEAQRLSMSPGEPEPKYAVTTP
ncbi:MAG: hypothetical protein MJH10_20910 [Epibacterium sp.]|nr:hypothetical protein [Epibacterium sp.]NQX75919.1 hypothetical protein [Epibacterium sp.]